MSQIEVREQFFSVPDENQTDQAVSLPAPRHINGDQVTKIGSQEADTESVTAYLRANARLRAAELLGLNTLEGRVERSDAVFEYINLDKPKL